MARHRQSLGPWDLPAVNFVVIPDPAYLMAISDAPLKDDKDKFLKYFVSVPLGLAMLGEHIARCCKSPDLLYSCPIVI